MQGESSLDMTTHMEVDISSRPEGSANKLSSKVVRRIFSFLNGKDLAKSRLVSRKWNEVACDDSLWKKLCIKKWRSLETDQALWKLIFSDVPCESPTKWRQVYPSVMSRTRWTCKLMKTERFLCNVTVHQLWGTPLGQDGLPSTIVVERRFNLLHLKTFILPQASILYLEPLEDKDKQGYTDFIDYMVQRNRAGLGLEELKRFIFVPPGEYTREYLGYDGPSLIGVIQTTYPPLDGPSPIGAVQRTYPPLKPTSSRKSRLE